eukprot:TRINITY_DN50948_c0_g1_i1.p1 TRINITY_DN50948_c0_g1~~TRINITY_DN50948_c0_g1_i1.p1  ORF type:complete len:615 (-),score=114.32 TRINITY_DN50948_c0_g1_i1:145-1989(-)
MSGEVSAVSASMNGGFDGSLSPQTLNDLDTVHLPLPSCRNGAGGGANWRMPASAASCGSLETLLHTYTDDHNGSARNGEDSPAGCFLRSDSGVDMAFTFAAPHRRADWLAQHVEHIDLPSPRWPEDIVGTKEADTEGGCAREENEESNDVAAEKRRRRQRERAQVQLESMASRYGRDPLLPGTKFFGRRHSKSTPNLARTANLLSIEEEETPAVPPSATADPRGEEIMQGGFSSGCCPSNVCGAVWKAFGRGNGSRSTQQGPMPTPPSVTPRYDSKDSAVVIFDWDDTLFPTSFLTHQVIPSFGQRQGAEPGVLRTLPKDSEYYNALAHHGRIVEFVLRTARQVARVVIVTLSMEPWVEASSEHYLPGTDLKSLLKELDIPVFYSRAHVKEEMQRWHATLDRTRAPGRQVGVEVDMLEGGSLMVRRVAPVGACAMWNAANPAMQVQPADQILSVNGQTERLVGVCRKEEVLDLEMLRVCVDQHAYVEAKGKDMLACLERLYWGQRRQRSGGDSPTSNGHSGAAYHWNVVSIGDSATEQQALKELLLPRKGDLTAGDSDALCKTVNLLTAPTIEQLGNELRILMVWLPRIVAYKKHFDLTMDGLDDLEKELFSVR